MIGHRARFRFLCMSCASVMLCVRRRWFSHVVKLVVERKRATLVINVGMGAGSRWLVGWAKLGWAGGLRNDTDVAAASVLGRDLGSFACLRWWITALVLSADGLRGRCKRQIRSLFGTCCVLV